MRQQLWQPVKKPNKFKVLIDTIVAIYCQDEVLHGNIPCLSCTSVRGDFWIYRMSRVKCPNCDPKWPEVTAKMVPCCVNENSPSPTFQVKIGTDVAASEFYSPGAPVQGMVGFSVCPRIQPSTVRYITIIILSWLAVAMSSEATRSVPAKWSIGTGRNRLELETNWHFPTRYNNVCFPEGTHSDVWITNPLNWCIAEHSWCSTRCDLLQDCMGFLSLYNLARKT